MVHEVATPPLNRSPLQSAPFLCPLASSSPEPECDCRSAHLLRTTMPAAALDWAHVNSVPDDDVLLTESVILLNSSDNDEELSRPSSRSSGRQRLDEKRLPSLVASSSGLRRSLSASESFPDDMQATSQRLTRRSSAAPRLGDPSARLLAKSTYDLEQRLTVLKVCMQPTPRENTRRQSTSALAPPRATSRRSSLPVPQPPRPQRKWCAEGDERDSLVSSLLRLDVTPRRTASLPTSPVFGSAHSTPWRSHSLSTTCLASERRLSGEAPRFNRRTTVTMSSPLIAVDTSSSCPPSPVLYSRAPRSLLAARKSPTPQVPEPLHVKDAERGFPLRRTKSDS